MKKIKLLKVRNIPLISNDIPTKGKDYLLALIVTPVAEEQSMRDEEEGDILYKMEVQRPEMLQEIGATKVMKIAKGYTPSQRLRVAIESFLQRVGREKEEYDTEMEKIIKHYNEKQI